MTKIIIPNLVPLTEHQQACVDLLEEILDAAKAGTIHTVGVIACMKNGFASAFAGPSASELNMGIDDLKWRVLSTARKKDLS